MTLKLVPRLACCFLAAMGVAQTPSPPAVPGPKPMPSPALATPGSVIQVVSVTTAAGPAPQLSATSVSGQAVAGMQKPTPTPGVHIQVHNKGTKDITYVSGTVVLTPPNTSGATVKSRSSAELLEPYVYAIKGYELRDGRGNKQPKGTLNAGEDVSWDFHPASPAGQATFTPDTVIFADQTWTGNEKVARDAFNERLRIAYEYGKVGHAVHDAEASPDPIARYQEILAEWLPKTGIQRTATTSSFRATKEFPTPDPYYRLEGYLGAHQWAVKELAAARAAGNNEATLASLVNARLQLMIRTDSAIGAAYKKHSEAK